MQGKNKPLLRYLEKDIKRLLAGRFSGLILGPRQAGKTTLVQGLLKDVDNKLEYYLQNPSVRLDLERDPGKIIRQAEAISKPPVIFIDEAQRIPAVFDSAQILIDGKKARLILTGSSARKLKREGVNLIPGRIKKYHLDPLLWGELGLIRHNTVKELKTGNINRKKDFGLNDTLVFGSLPGIVSLPQKERADMLRSYAEIYLEEEIRAEALSRKIGAFSRFLELAAVESGTSPNFTKLSNDSGVSQPAIKEYYRLLEDTLVMERIEPYLKNARKRILSSARYYFFDIGVRNTLSRLPLEKNILNLQKGVLFEHAVMLEIIRRVRVLNRNYRVCFWRTAAGAEVDCVIDTGTSLIPIEIKSARQVTRGELKGLKIFLEDYKDKATQGYVITQGERKEKLADNIISIPWCDL